MASSLPLPGVRGPAPAAAGSAPPSAAPRPVRPPNVRLVGELRDAGFADRQWLVERDGRFLQLTELLYRILEAVDGQRSYAEIAASVTAATPWQVGADQVRYLIEAKLAPLHLLTTANHAAAANPSQRPSLLAVNVHAKMIRPERIEAVTAKLHVLYAPVLAIPLLLLVAAAHVWLYAGHGIAAGLRQPLRAPGLLLVVLAVLAATGLVHEFGHATALRRGGGQVRGMGIGFYLAAPTFYTDVSDSYRLGRWARLRTDVGGWYFELITTLAIFGLYALTGQAFLLVLVILIDLRIASGALPIVRMDGYWVIADLVGVPDFLSQIGPFLRGLLPGGRRHRLPALRPWAKAVFTAYVLITVPALAALAWVVATHLPLVVETALHTAWTQAQIVAMAQVAGDTRAAMLAAGQLLLVVLPLVGIVVFAISLGQRLLGAAWHLARPTRTRRALAVLAISGLVAGVILAGPFQLPTFDAGTGNGAAAALTKPLTGREVPATALCTVAPRSPAALLALLGTQPDLRDLLTVPRSFVPPAGRPVPTAVLTGVTATARELLACTNAGAPLRAFALASDRYVRSMALPPAAAASLAAPPVPRPPAQRAALLAIQGARLLPNGRVGAFVVSDDPARTPHMQTAFVTFLQQGDHWLVDEVVPGVVPSTQSAPKPAVEARR